MNMNRQFFASLALAASAAGLSCTGSNSNDEPDHPDGATLGTPCVPMPTPEASTPDASTPDASTPEASTPEAAILGAAIDPNVVAMATGVTPQVTGHIVKVTFPRTDLQFTIDNWTAMPPFMGLTSYAAFTPTINMGDHVAVMGDVVLLEDEVNPAMDAALGAGLEVTALHNHFFFDSPHVYFMHIGGMAPVAQLAAGVKKTIDAVTAVRQARPTPSANFGAMPISGMSQITAAPLDAALGVTGATQAGMYKASFPRTITSDMCGGCVLSGSEAAQMGVYTWAAVGGTDANAAIDGDFAATSTELQPVLKALRAGGITIVAIHAHMTGDTPRLVFLHYWGRGAAMQLAATVKSGVDLTAWDGNHPGGG
jgi:hypothetical protein